MEPQLSRCPGSKEEAKQATVMRGSSKRKQEDQSQLGAQGAVGGEGREGFREARKLAVRKQPVCQGRQRPGANSFMTSRALGLFLPRVLLPRMLLPLP